MPIKSGNQEPSAILHIDESAQQGSGHSLLIRCSQCFFVSVAVLLSSGILGLPLKLHRSGFFPFLLTFSPNVLLQILVVYFFVIVLQVCDSALEESLHDDNTYNSLNGLSLVETDTASNGGSPPPDHANHEETTSNDGGKVNLNLPKRVRFNIQTSSKITTNLHVLAKLFFPRWLRFLVGPLFLIEFTLILTCYALAGSEAAGQLFGINYVYMIPVFVISLSVIILVTYAIIQPIVSVLTLIKGLVFMVVCVIGVSLGSESHNPITTNWKYAADPILFETLALGGLPLCMPMIYEKFGKTKKEIRAFRNSIFSAIIFCAFLNVLWAWSVLSVVPQLDSSCRTPTTNITTRLVEVKSQPPLDDATTTVASKEMACDPSSSLEAALLSGTITTIPFTKMVIQRNPKMAFCAVLIRIFVSLSTAVSFLVIGASLHHTIIGFTNFLMTLRRMKYAAESRAIPSSTGRFNFLSSNFFWHILSSSGFFFLIFCIAMAQPQSMIKLFERYVSIGLNFAGPAVFLMFQRVWLPPYSHLSIPLSSNSKVRPFRYLILLYYGGIIVYDLVVIIYDMVAS